MGQKQKRNHGEPSINIRMSAELLLEVDALIPIVRASTQLRAAGQVSRSTVVRLAVIEGMDVLRKTYGSPGKAGKGKARK